MGGCKCSFRECKNSSSNNPSMHFFHFPVKNLEKMNKWVKYANAEHILKLEHSQAANKTVCAEHFRDECFMNYKKNKLTKIAIPTLTVLYEDDKGKVALDYKISDCPEPVRIPFPTAKHLLPPVNVINSKIQLLEEDVVYFNLNKNEKTSAVEVRVRDPEVVNVQVNDDTTIHTNNYEIIEIGNCLDKESAEWAPENMEIGNNSNELIYENLEPVNFESNIRKVHDKEQSKQNDFNGQDLEVLASELKSTKNRIQELEKIVEKTRTDSETKIGSLQQKVEAKDLEIGQLKAQLSKLSSAQIQSNTKIDLPTPLNKTHLFQSIKKYLSPSMATMVCMEMFGSSEREWKEDEKERAVELLQLGESVFCYFRDEWRFRLPPQRDVKKWMQGGSDS